MKYRFSGAVISLGLVFLFAQVGFSQTCSEPGSIKRVKNRSAGKFEYVIFDIIKPNAPTYSVETRKAPFTDYSGDEKFKIKGNKHKVIVFKSLNWMCKSRERFSVPQRAVKDVKMLWAFEGIAEYVVGYRSRSRYLGTYHYDVGKIRKVVMKFRK